MAAKDIEKHQFKKGETGNPAGRPKKLPELETLLADVLGNDEGGNIEAKEILQALAKRAKKGDTRAAQLLLEHAYGKPRQRVEIFGGDDIGRNRQPTVLIQYRSSGEASGNSGNTDGDKGNEG